MKTLQIIVAALVAVSLSTATLLADLPPPSNLTQKEREEWERRRDADPSRAARIRLFEQGLGIIPKEAILPLVKEKPASLVLYGADKRGFRLLLPGKLVKDLQAALSPKTSSLDSGWHNFPLPSIMIGLALSLGLASAGFCLAKSRRRWSYGFTCLLAGTLIVIGVGCPALRRNEDAKTDAAVRNPTLTREGQVRGRVTVEVSENPDKVEVVMDKETLSSFLAQNGIKTE